MIDWLPSKPDAVAWLTLLFAFLSAAFGGIGTQWYSHRRQAERDRLQAERELQRDRLQAEREAERARNSRRREALTTLQSVLETHSLTAVAWFNATEQRLRETGHWQPIGLSVPNIPGITDRPLTVSTVHLAARVANDDLRRLVREHAEAIGAATFGASSYDEASQALKRVGERYAEAQTLIETLLKEIP